MLRDCFRCGYGWMDNGDRPLCICHGMTEGQAAYVKALHDQSMYLRKVARKSVDGRTLTNLELGSIGIYV